MSAISGVVSSIYTPTAMYGIGAKVGNIRLPDFNSALAYTKTEPSMSDEEIKEAVIKIAKEDAEKGLFQNHSKDFLELRKEYVSSVSPDRESIITNSTKQIFANADAVKSKTEKHAITLLELLIDKDKNDKIIAINMNSSNYKACFEGDKLTYAEYHDSNGELIATYGSNTGWDCIQTKAEGVRSREFNATYNEAWASADAEMKARNKSVPKHLEGGATIDAYA